MIFAFACLLLTGMSIYDEPWHAAIGTLIVIVGIPFYYLQVYLLKNRVEASECLLNQSNLGHNLYFVNFYLPI